MPTVSPHYQQKGVPNPYYTMDELTIGAARAGLKKEGFDTKNKDIFFKCVDNVKGKIIYKTTGKFVFQLALDKKSILPYGIQVTKKAIKGHLGMVTRKNSTASSNVNEFLTVYFLKNKHMDPKALENHSCLMGKKSTGVKTGEGKDVTFDDLCHLIDEDETPERDIRIGLNNAIAVKKDIGAKAIKNLYWVPRGKPSGISPKTPSDVIIEFNNGTFLGYSNKIAAGKDETPKFNTNIYAFYGKLEDGSQQSNIGKIVDGAWNKAARTVTGTTAKGAINAFDISKEPFSESASKEAFGKLASAFRKDKKDFYADDFYYKFRNNLINDFSKYLTEPKNMVYFLNTIYFYTYDDPRSTFKPCPYKLLIGRENGKSDIKDVSDNEELKELLINKKITNVKNITTDYDNKSQSFKMNFNFDGQKVQIPITCRTRQAGGWSGKSLFITTSGVKLL